ncbi:MAG TPA: hybrid sensor histidine kinase/response regulator, partial [Cyanobacteria bacterium UBA8543]|nr:hybrid sensor histidine kinase/response regulator [Cyanobacteria bacterium UBA8543]
EQSYHYFLQEAPELLQVLEQELLSLREDYSINKVHTLMRTTHTLKGAAASVGLETIKTVAHSLEDIFKALFNPELSIDPEVEALLFEGYECLSLPIAAELTGIQANDAEILDRTAAVFAQLQNKLGNCFGQESQLPSSVELGFDVTQSIFEVGVTQRLDEIACAIATANPTAIATVLRTQAEVFQGLAESLALPGFGAIAYMTISALDARPDQVISIAQMALADFQAGQAAVLEGDRTHGGEPSLALQEIAGPIVDSTELIQAEGENSLTQDELNWVTPAANSELGLSELQECETSLNELPQEESVNPLLEMIWGGETLLDTETSTQPDLESANFISTTRTEQEELNLTDNAAYASSQQTSAAPASLSDDEPEDIVKIPLYQNQRTDNPQNSIPQKDQVSPSRTVRINVEHLEHLNSSMGELLTNQNRQSLENEQLKTAVRSLLARLKQHQQLLGQLQDWSDHLFVDAEQRQILEWSMGQTRSNSYYLSQNSTFSHTSLSRGGTKVQNRFDSLELDRYSEAQILVQSILEDAVKLAEATEEIDLFATQSNQTLEKQRRLLTSTRDVLLEARMLPLGDIFGRFHSVLQQLKALHNKSVVLEFRGTEVLVDKVVAQKLYGPLLHLVRNAFDHGIESFAVRQQWGKPQKGQIEISAYYRGKSLVIEVRDDGQGLDFERIRQRAVECQLVDASQAMSLNEGQLTN